MRSGPFPAGGRAGSRPGLRLRYLRLGGFLATRGLLAGFVGEGVELPPPLLRHPPRRGESGQPVHRGAHHVVRVGRAQALGREAAPAGALEHGAPGPAGDHAGPRRRRLEEHPARSVVADDLMGDRAAGERHLHHVAACGLHGLAHRLADLVRLPGRDPDGALAVADCDEPIEPEAPASLHDRGDAIDRDHVLDQAVALALPLAALVAAGTAATAAPRPAPPAPLLRRSTLHAASPGPPGPRRRPPPPPSPRRCGAPRAPPPRCDPALPASPLFPFVLPLKSNPPFPAPSATPLTPPRYL